MSPWRRTGLVVTALLLACTKPNPAFDPNPSGSASEGAGPTSDPGTSTTDTPPTTSTSTSTTATATATTTTHPVVTTTTATTDDSSTGPACSLPGEPCGPAGCCGCGTCSAGLCAPDDAKCGTCSACGDSGECGPQPPRTPCELAEDPCVDKLHGVEDGKCFANGPAEGLCDGGAQCQAKECVKGDMLASCEFACIKNAEVCGNGMPLAGFDLDSFCAQNEPTPECADQCVEGDLMDSIAERSCQQGVCKELKQTFCGFFKCKNPDMCPALCVAHDQCKLGHLCFMNMCQ